MVASYSDGAVIQVSAASGGRNPSYSCINVQNVMH